MVKKGKLFAKNNDEWIEIGGGDENALPKTGGAMTGYLADKTALQVRNVMTATEKPADTIGMDGDVCMVPGASGGSSGGGVGPTGILLIGNLVGGLLDQYFSIPILTDETEFNALKWFLPDGSLVKNAKLVISDWKYDGSKYGHKIFHYTSGDKKSPCGIFYNLSEGK